MKMPRGFCGIFEFGVLLCFVFVVLVTPCPRRWPGNKGDNGEGEQVLPVETTPTTTTTTVLLKQPIIASTCSNDTTITPCAYEIRSQGIRMECSDSEVNQTSIENIFREVRRVNEFPGDRGVGIFGFDLDDSELTQLDLAPFYGSRMSYLSISRNGNLTKLVTSGNPEDHESIHAAAFSISWSPMNREGFGDALKYFSNEMTSFTAWNLDLSNPNNSNKNDDKDEFLPGFSAFTNLTHLELNICNISGSLKSSHLKAFPKLQEIGLYKSEIDGIGENVFPSDVSIIDLKNNNLTETSFHPNSGITKNGRKKTLHLSYNQMTTLPSEIFLPFLDAHPENSLSLYGNPLVCDDKLCWIKSRREEFQSRVKGAECINDNGRTIFNSNLIN